MEQNFDDQDLENYDWTEHDFDANDDNFSFLHEQDSVDNIQRGNAGSEIERNLLNADEDLNREDFSLDHSHQFLSDDGWGNAFGDFEPQNVENVRIWENSELNENQFNGNFPGLKEEMHIDFSPDKLIEISNLQLAISRLKDILNCCSNHMKPLASKESNVSSVAFLDMGSGSITKPFDNANNENVSFEAVKTEEKSKEKNFFNSNLLAPAKWFAQEEISTLEERMLPEFFTGIDPFKTPLIYKQTRNYIIRMFKERLFLSGNPNSHVTATECRQRLAGDVTSILRIHEFLEVFGLINIGSASTKPNLLRFNMPVDLWPNVLQSTEKIPQRLFDKIKFPGLKEGPDEFREKWDIAQLKKLIESANEYAGDWSKVAQCLGIGADASTCFRKFLSLSPKQVLVALDSNNQKNGECALDGDSKEISHEIPKHLRGVADQASDPFRSEMPPLMALLKGLSEKSDPQVVKTSYDAGLKVMKMKGRFCGSGKGLHSRETLDLTNELLVLRMGKVKRKIEHLKSREIALQGHAEDFALRASEFEVYQAGKWQSKKTGDLKEEMTFKDVKGN